MYELPRRIGHSAQLRGNRIKDMRQFGSYTAMSETLTVPAASLRLTPEIAESIRNVSFEGLKSLPRRGAEIGGLITASGSSPALGDDVVLVKCEYLFGPSYRLSDNDLPLLREAAERCNEDGRVVAAFFRSCTGSHDEVDGNDQHAILEACPEVPFVVLARPSLNGRARIGVYRRGVDDTWTIADEFTVSSPVGISVPLHGGKMPPQETLTARASAAFVPPEPERGAALARIPGGAATNSALWRAKAWWLLFPGVALLAAFLFLAVRTKPRQQLESPVAAPAGASARNAVADSAPGLAVRPEGGQLHLTWNRNADAVRSANSGILNIDDGGSPVLVVLGPSDLTEGSLVYTPHSSDVKFRLRLRSSSGAEAEEVIRVVGATGAPRSVTAAKTEKTPEAVPKRAMTAEPVFRKASTPAPATPAAVTPAAARVGTTSESASPPPVISEQQARPSASQLYATPITVPNTPLNIPPNRSTNNQQAIASESDHPNTPPVSRDAGVTRQSQPEAPAPPASVPAVATPPVASTAALVPPVPLRQVVPKIAVPYLSVLVTTPIAILVSVDARGNVTDAHSETDNKGKNPYLQGLALDAARQWKFKPATVRGQAVAGESRITFVFTPR